MAIPQVKKSCTNTQSCYSILNLISSEIKLRKKCSPKKIVNCKGYNFFIYYGKMEQACIWLIFKIASSWQLTMITGQLLEVVTLKNMEIVLAFLRVVKIESKEKIWTIQALIWAVQPINLSFWSMPRACWSYMSIIILHISQKTSVLYFVIDF